LKNSSERNSQNCRGQQSRKVSVSKWIRKILMKILLVNLEKKGNICMYLGYNIRMKSKKDLIRIIVAFLQEWHRFITRIENTGVLLQMWINLKMLWLKGIFMRIIKILYIKNIVIVEIVLFFHILLTFEFY
jgi:hypothetical protein